MTIVHDTATEKSRLVIIDAQNFNGPPVATIHLPQRVPYGAHGNWVYLTGANTTGCAINFFIFASLTPHVDIKIARAASASVGENSSVT
jgi:hypothetical protein